MKDGKYGILKVKGHKILKSLFLFLHCHNMHFSAILYLAKQPRNCDVIQPYQCGVV